MKNYNQLVESLWSGAAEQEGEVGIEIECEGSNLPREIPSYWSVHQDGSLRGESAEYVLRKPVRRDNVLRFLQYLQKKLTDANATLDYSNRTSVHVHLNMQGVQLRQVYNLICLYLIFEDMLTQYAGPTRVGNLFCLRVKDAEYLADRLAYAAQRDEYEDFGNENKLRYASINVCALRKFNSLEFRALRGTNDPNVIHDWVSLLLALKDAALRYREPREIILDFSASGARGFMEKVFPDPLWRGFSRGLDTNAMLWEGVRIVQEIAYATDWQIEQVPRKRVFQEKRPMSPQVANDEVMERARTLLIRARAVTATENVTLTPQWANPAPVPTPPAHWGNPFANFTIDDQGRPVHITRTQ